MTAGSNVNPNFPIPGIDQSSRGFRDNFATIKQEITDLQAKELVFGGALFGTPTVSMDSGPGQVFINASFNAGNIAVFDVPGSLLYIGADQNIAGTGGQLVWDDLNKKMVLNDSLNTTAMEFQVQPASSTISGAGIFSLVASTSGIGLTITPDGLVGVNQFTPSFQFEVNSGDYAPAQFYSGSNNTDNGVRLTTDQYNSTMGIVLEHRYADKVGGMRIDNAGNISIHSGEPMDGGLSDTTRRITIMAAGEVGINQPLPTYALDVVGDVKVTDAVMANVLVLDRSVTMAPMVAPASPASGFTIYTDISDGALKAIASTGNVTVLAYP